MIPQTVLSRSDFENLQALDTCTASNAIETLNVRLRNEGFVSGSVHCQFPHFQPMLGYAVTGRIRTSSAPMTGRCYYDRIDWWNYVASIPAPRVMVLQDCDHKPGIGALVGEIHAAIGLALNCVGYVTNGAVRDLPAVEAQGFHLFAGSVAVSHAYAHIVEMAEPVELGGLKILPGDLMHGDRHGVHTIPLSIASEIPAAAARLLSKEQELIDFCRSSHFSLAGLADLLRRTSGTQSTHHPTLKGR
jgi:regulator of RNase E activity RraA